MTLAEKQNLGIQDQGEVHLLKQDFYFVVISVTIEVKKKSISCYTFVNCH